MIITFQISAVLHKLSMGITEATCVLVGNQIGADNVPLAKHYTRLTFTQSMICAAIISTLLFIFKVEICTIFTSGQEEGIDVSLAIAVIPIFIITNFLDEGLAFV